MPQPSLTPAVMLHLLRKHAWVWIAPAVAGLFLAAFGSLLTPRKWSATQGLIVRSEAAGYADQRLGKFTDLSEMKTVQETMLELARSQSVVTAVLEEVGPKSSWGSRNWPSREDVSKFRKHLTITPPGGAEFGNTEVFYIEVTDSSPKRAERLVAALADQLETRLQGLRNERASSMVHELQRGVDAATAQLNQEVGKLADFEAGVGPHLSELRNLTAQNGSQSSLDQQSSAIEQDLRALDSKRQANEKLLAALESSGQHPERLLSTPSTLLAAQPTLLRLKEGLVNAQIQKASLLGTRSTEHPLVKAAEETIDNLRQAINRHAPESIRGVEMELSVAQSREQSLRIKIAKIQATQTKLAKQRAEYAVLLANVQNQSGVVDSARKQLADAQAVRAGARGSSVLARIDAAEAGLYPVGPGRTSVALAGGLAGLLAGLGGVFVFYAPKTRQPVEVAAPFESPAEPPVATTVEGLRATDHTTVQTGAFASSGYVASDSVFVGS